MDQNYLLKLWDGAHPRRSAHKILKEKPLITLHHNNESGEWRWSVVLDGTGLWLNSFNRKESAESFLSGYVDNFRVVDDK